MDEMILSWQWHKQDTDTNTSIESAHSSTNENDTSDKRVILPTNQSISLYMQTLSITTPKNIDIKIIIEN